MVSEVTLMSRIRGSVLTTMFMPRLNDDLIMTRNQPPNDVQLPRTKAMIIGKLYGFQPKFTVSSLAPYVDVDRFVAIEAVEEKPEWSRDVLDSGHSPTSSFRADVQNSPRVYATVPPPSSLDKLCLQQCPDANADKPDACHVLQMLLADIMRYCHPARTPIADVTM